MADTSLTPRRILAKACDTCRARKVRCRVDTGFEQCNQCRKIGTGSECRWSQKRRPRRRTRLEKESDTQRAAATASDPNHATSTPLQIVSPLSSAPTPASVLPVASTQIATSPFISPLVGRSGDHPPTYFDGPNVEHPNRLRPQITAQEIERSRESTAIPTLYIDALLDKSMSFARNNRDHLQGQPQTLSDCFSEPPALTLQDLCGGTNLSLAFLSKRRLAALSNRLGHDRLNLLVDTIESVLETRMKSVDKVPSNYGPRPDHDKSIPEAQGEAASYIQSYFEQVHPIYPFLNRTLFEERAFNAQLAHQFESDKSWSALYHAVLAIGCQYHDCGSFEPGKGLAWKYFEIIFSLCPDLLISKASLTTVQALTAMAVFARNVSCLQLESITVSQAARMAQSLGYNRASASSDQSIQRTFWVLYCMEKTTCFYTGKTSLLNDSDIGFAPPSYPEPAFQSFDWLASFSRYGRLVSCIYENLFAINAAGKPASTYYAIIDELRSKLESWRSAIPAPFRPGDAFRVRVFSGPLATTLGVFVNYLYFSVLLALSRGTLYVAKVTEEQCMRHQTAKHELMETARRILELTKFVEVETYTSVWVLAFMPLSALFILFDFVVHNPMHHETNSNLALLDMAGGHFSNFEYVSRGTLPASLAAEFAHIARQYVQDFRQQQHQRTEDSTARLANGRASKAPSVTTAVTGVPDPTSTAEDLWKMTGIIRLPDNPENGLSEPSQKEQPSQTVTSNLGLEYTDPIFFSLGDDSLSTTADSGLGIDIMDLFDINLSDIFSSAS